MRSSVKIAAILLVLAFPGAAFGQDATPKNAFDQATIEVYDNPDKAIVIANQILDTTNDSQSKIDVYLLISNAYASKREYEKSLSYALLAEDESENSGDLFSQMQVLTAIAAKYHQLKINEKALQYLTKAEECYNNLKDKSQARLTLGTNYVIRGFIFREKLNCEIALEYFNKAIGLYRKNKVQNTMTQVNLSIFIYNKGNCFITLNQLDSATASFTEAYSLAQGIDAKSLQGFALKGLAEVYTLEGNYKKSLLQQEQALKIAKDVGDLILYQSIYQGMANNYLALNQWENYLYYSKKFSVTEQQTTSSERNSIEISLLTQAAETEKLVAKQHTIFTILIVIALSFAALFSVLLYKRYRRYRSRLAEIKARLYQQTGTSQL